MFLSDPAPITLPNELIGSAKVAALLGNPNLSDAIRTLCEGLDAVYRRNPLLSLIGGDRGRMTIGWMTLYLDAERRDEAPDSGLTVNRFKAHCAALDLCSPGRAAAMIGVMRFAGYLQPATNRVRGRPVQLVPTEKFLTEQRLRYERIFQALRLVAPEGDSGLGLMHDPDFPRHFVRGAGDWFASGAQPIRHAPSLLSFARKKAGLHILMRLMLSGEPGDAMPPEGPLTLSVAECARRFGVSRAQVNEVLATPLSEGLIKQVTLNAHRYVLSPELRQDVRRFGAAVFAMLIEGVRAAAARMS